MIIKLAQMLSGTHIIAQSCQRPTEFMWH